MTLIRFLFVLALGSALATVPAHSEDSSPLRPFEARYKVRMSGLSGTMAMSLEQRDGGFYARTELKPKGLASVFARGELVETARFDITARRVRPLDYQMRDTIARNDETGSLVFDWPSNTASGSSDGDALSYTIDALTLDRLSLQYALMLDLNEGRSAPAYTMLDRDRRKSLTISQAGTQTIEVPFGQFEVHEVRHQNQGSSRRTVLYCAKELGYLPVRIEQYKNDDLRVRANLVAYRAK